MFDTSPPQAIGNLQPSFIRFTIDKNLVHVRHSKTFGCATSHTLQALTKAVKARNTESLRSLSQRTITS